MARAIDADALQELCNTIIQDEWNSRTAPESWAEAYESFKDDIDSMPTITPPNEWVSVEERLPDKPGHYLVCTSVNYLHGGCMDKNDVSSNKGTTDGYVDTTLNVLDCFYDTTGDWNRVWNKHVTHWMNIPAPPEGEGNA